MSLRAPAPLELELIPLPPIPGSLPPTFFTETPQRPLAVFSTHLSTRPFRNLPNPVPPHVIRSADYEDVTRKAWCLLHTYPEVTESIFTPPAAWTDLYHYFDAMDLWTEGAGFLFHVLGFIVRANWTRFNCLRLYADKWALIHETRLINMPKLQPHLLGSVFTAEDDAWFDFNGLTPYQKNALTVVLNSHRDVLRAKHNSLRVDRRRRADYSGREMWRPDNAQSLEPHQCNERPVTPLLKPTGQQLSGASPLFIPTKLTASQEIRGNQFLTRSRSYNEKEGSYRSYMKPQVTMREFTPASKTELSGTHVDRGFFQLESPFHGLAGLHGGLRNPHRTGSSQADFKQGSGPVYIFNGQKPTTETKYEIATTSRQPSATVYPAYHVPQHVQTRIQGNNSTGPSGNTWRFNASKGASNDARVFYETEFVRRQDEGARSQNQIIGKAIWPDTDQEPGCTVFVGGLSDEALEKQTAKELLSKCGLIKNVKPLRGRGCCFVEFANRDSALQAIQIFHRYVTDEGVTLKVQHARPKRTNKNIHNDAHHERRESAQRLHYKNASPPGRQALRSGRQTTGSSPSSLSRPDSTPSTMNSSPPHALPSKPKSRLVVRGYPLSTSFDSQMNFVDRLIQTANGNGLPVRLNGRTISLDECSNGRFEQDIYEPQNKTANSFKKRKSYRRKSESAGSTLIHTPTKQLPDGLAKDFMIPSSSQMWGGPIEPDSLTSKAGLIISRSWSGYSEIAPIPKFSQSQNRFASSDPTVLREKQSILEHDDKTEPLASAEAKTLDTSKANVDNDSNFLLTRKYPNVLPGDARTELLEKAEVTESLAQSVDSIGLDKTKQIIKTPSGTKTKLGKTSTARIKGVAQPDNTTAHNSLVEGNIKQSSGKSLELHLKTRGDTRISATSSCHDAKLEAEKLHYDSETDAKRGICSRNTTKEILTLPNIHSRQKPKQAKQLKQSKINSGEDAFSDCTPKAARGCQKFDEGSPANFQTNSSSRSSARDSRPRGKRSKFQAQDESPTPKGLRRKLSKSSRNSFEQKENMSPPPLTRLLLSDLEQWPALGIGKAQADLKPMKPLVDRTTQPASIRRDSSASVVSSLSPQPTRRLTVTAASPPSSVGSPLWPVVKRWDSYKTTTNRS